MKKLKIFTLILILAAGRLSCLGQQGSVLEHIRVGQQVPDIKLEGLQYKGSNNVRTSDFKDQVLIIDFWATYCEPCIAMMPLMDSLQREFEGQLQFISVTAENEIRVKRFLDRRKALGGYVSKLPKISGDTVLAGLFPHRTLPHYVWIAPGGLVAAITEGEEVTRKNISALLDKGKLKVRIKTDTEVLAYDRDRIPLKQLLYGSSAILTQEPQDYSFLTGFIPALGANGGHSVPSPDSAVQRLTVTNLSLKSLYQLAYGKGKRFFGDNTVKLSVASDSLLRSNASGLKARDWIWKHTWCYEVSQQKTAVGTVYEKMQQDLERWFPDFNAEVVRAFGKCLVLERLDDSIQMASSGGEEIADFGPEGYRIGNTSVKVLITMLDALVFSYGNLPLVDGTAYKGKADIVLAGDISDLQKLNDQLQRFGLKVQEKEQVYEMLLISDR